MINDIILFGEKDDDKPVPMLGFECRDLEPSKFYFSTNDDSFKVKIKNVKIAEFRSSFRYLYYDTLTFILTRSIIFTFVKS